MLRDGSTVDDRAAVFNVQEAQIGHQRTLERSGTGPEEGIALLQRQLNGKADFVRPALRRGQRDPSPKADISRQP
jgi:hypothetical protein